MSTGTDVDVSASCHCRVCRGSGEVTRIGYDGEPESDACYWCDGTGSMDALSLRRLLCEHEEMA